MNSVFDTLEQRGFVTQVTDPGLGAWLGENRATVYVGFDPTADSLHLGHLVPIMALAHFQRAGHTVLPVVGGATGMVGDPSGRSEERNLLTADQIKHNVECIKEQLGRYLDFEGEHAALMLDNHDWIGPLSFIDWLRDVGKHFTLSTMLGKESVKRRLESEHGISFTEFSYQTMQAYDFLHLHRQHGCRLQCGGSDQWGNIVAGIDLIRKVTGGEAFGFTMPLVCTASGQKIGKSEGNAVWLDARRTSPYQLYQYWMQTEDSDVERFLKLYTFVGLDEIDALCRLHSERPEAREAQKRLAAETTRLVHGDVGLAAAERATRALFGGDLDGLTARDLFEIFADVPSSRLEAAELDAGLPLVDLLPRTGLTKSKGEARRFIKQGGVYLNNRRCDGDDLRLDRASLLADAVMVLRHGKKSYHLVRVV